MTYRQIIGLSSVTLCLCISIAACDKANLAEVMKVANQAAGGQTAEGGTPGAEMASIAKLLPDGMIPIPPSFLAKAGNLLYDREIEQREKENEKETDPNVTGQIDRIFQRLMEAARNDPRYGEVAKEMDWRLNTIREKQELAMAAAYPGGGIAVYTGVFKVAENEGALAAILGHEMAHVLARHALKRLGGHVAVAVATMGPMIASGIRPDKMDPKIVVPVASALGAGYLFGGRQLWQQSQEEDADCLGLELAAKAGYDPAKIQGFWQRMEDKEEEVNKSYAFLNEHPINPKRLEHINNSCMSKSKDIYNQLKNEERQDASAVLPGVVG